MMILVRFQKIQDQTSKISPEAIRQAQKTCPKKWKKHRQIVLPETDSVLAGKFLFVLIYQQGFRFFGDSIFVDDYLDDIFFCRQIVHDVKQ